MMLTTNPAICPAPRRASWILVAACLASTSAVAQITGVNGSVSLAAGTTISVTGPAQTQPPPVTVDLTGTTSLSDSASTADSLTGINGDSASASASGTASYSYDAVTGVLTSSGSGLATASSSCVIYFGNQVCGGVAATGNAATSVFFTVTTATPYVLSASTSAVPPGSAQVTLSGTVGGVRPASGTLAPGQYSVNAFASGGASPTQPGGTVSVTESFSYSLSFGPTQQLSYTITLSGLAEIEPSQFAISNSANQLPFTVTVKDSNGAPAAGIAVHLVLSAKSGSGGHNHGDDSRPERTGMFSANSGQSLDATTDATGSAAVIFSAPSVSGTINVVATCVSQSCTQTGPNSIDVRIQERLTALGAGADFYPYGQTTTHSDNHWLTTTAKFKARQLAQRWHRANPNLPVLAYNDASLEWGGRFDIDADWYPPHAEHRRGVVIDVQANGSPTSIPRAPKDYVPLFVQKVKQLGGGTLVHPDHVHVRLLGVAQ